MCLAQKIELLLIGAKTQSFFISTKCKQVVLKDEAME